MEERLKSIATWFLEGLIALLGILLTYICGSQGNHQTSAYLGMNE